MTSYKVQIAYNIYSGEEIVPVSIATITKWIDAYSEEDATEKAFLFGEKSWQREITTVKVLEREAPPEVPPELEDRLLPADWADWADAP